MSRNHERSQIPKVVLGSILNSDAGHAACESTRLAPCHARKEVSKEVSKAWSLAMDAASIPATVNGSEISEDDKRNLLRLGITPKLLEDDDAREGLISKVWMEAQKHVDGYAFFLKEESLGGIALERAVKYAAEEVGLLRKFHDPNNIRHAFCVKCATKHIYEIIKTGEMVAETRGPVHLTQREEFITRALRIAGIHIFLAETIAHLYVEHFKGRSQ